MIPKVTIFCPIYNDLRYVDDLMESVLGQTYRHFVFLILENGSTNRTRSKINSYRDSRIKVVNSHINLRSETGSHVLKSVDTEYLSIIFADDIYLPHRLERSVEALESTGADACFSNNLYMWDNKEPVDSEDIPPSQFSGNIAEMSVPEHLWHFAMRGNSLHPVSMTIRTSAYRSLGGFRPDMHQIGDMEFFCRLLLRKSVLFLEEPLQRIRLKGKDASDKARNESAITPQSVGRIRAERLNFLQNYRSEEALEIVDKIFLPSARGIEIPSPMRLWYLGQQFINSYEPDYRFFGISCLYDSLRVNGSVIEGALTASLGVSPAAYIDRISPQVFSGFGREDQDFEIAKLKNALEILTTGTGTGSHHSSPADTVFFAFGETITRMKLEYFKRLSLRRRLPLQAYLPTFKRHKLSRGLPGFDHNFYIQTYSDVRRRRVDPLLHFLCYGWRSGRDPSASFSVKGYLDSNPDVRAARINPLLHFIEYGFREGRQGWKT